MEWQPIETAPNDGTTVLFWSRKCGFFAGNWPNKCEKGMWTKVDNQWEGSFHVYARNATHWMPLPKAPE